MKPTKSRCLSIFLALCTLPLVDLAEMSIASNSDSLVPASANGKSSSAQADSVEQTSQSEPKEGDSKIHVAVITGGHGFDEESFLSLFKGHDDVAFDHLAQEDDSEVFEDISDWQYDVIVFYHMTQKISPQRQAIFLHLLDQGVGVVALHHSIAAFQDWPEYEKIIGGKYLLKDRAEKEGNGKASGFKHDVEFTIHLEDHPITQGLKDFKVQDETYINCTFEPDNTPLLTTDDPTSDKLIGWTRTYRNARICYIQPGHGVSIFANETYQSIVARAIRWCAGRM